MMRVVIPLVMLLVLCGCGTIRSQLRSDLAKHVDAATEKSLDKIIDAKVAASLQRELPAAVSAGIGRWLFDTGAATGPYGLAGILALLLGKVHHDHRKLKLERKKQ